MRTEYEEYRDTGMLGGYDPGGAILRETESGEGLVESHTGAKSCVHADAGRVAALRQELTETELRAMVRSMKRMGLDRQSAWSLFERLYAEEETE